MTSLNISLPDAMRAWIDEQVVKGDYGTASELVRELIREAQKRQAQADLEAKLIEGLDSGPAREMTQQDWDDLKARVQEDAARRNRK
ncbi:MAG: type II toxin-antitoxin system ParD family antitoxin [Planctomycetes bacterium]|nr:type II toxin-antitoxin system ParD family antitoxin [Planctomycetota bacterium]